MKTIDEIVDQNYTHDTSSVYDCMRIYASQQTAELQKELSDFKALVKQMRESQSIVYNQPDPSFTECETAGILETQVDKYLQE